MLTYFNILIWFGFPWASIGYNDLGFFHAATPGTCAALCLMEQQCVSFDYGARSAAAGDCILSTASRATAGRAILVNNLYRGHMLS